MMVFKPLIAATVLLTLAGCWNGGNAHIRLGDVSLGQQMIDLKTALEAGAMTQAEYDETKQTLLSINEVCRNTEEDEG